MQTLNTIMPTVTLYILPGFLLLLGGACFLVDGAKNLALKFNVRPLIIAVTIIAFGTSSPELLVSLVSALKGRDSMALGNVIGSNIANIALVLGIACIIKPVSAATVKSLKKVDIPVMLACAVALYIFSLDGLISRFDGGFLLIGLCAYFVYCIRSGKEKNENPDPLPPKSKIFYAVVTVLGLVAIVFGAHWLVKGGVELARSYKLSPSFIAVSVFAIGSSLPELATSVVASIKKQHEISIGNVVGSNIQNIALVIGVVALIRPLNCSSGDLNSSFIVLLTYSVLLFVILWFTDKLPRFVGVLFVLSYAVYIWMQAR